MDFNIRNMEKKDKKQVVGMMRVFYASSAVLTDGSEEIFEADFENCVGANPYVEGYIFENGGEVMGYAMAAKSFSTEFGRRCVWIEDIYVKEDFRGMGAGGRFLDFIEEKYPDAVIRLEAEEENVRAVNVYKKHGFKVIPYLEMIKRR